MSAQAPERASAYLDHAATTPVMADVVSAYSQELQLGGNASSLHATGRTARRRLEEAREELAGAVGARPSEVIFTAGATEADNLALKGLFWARNQETKRPRILISAVEHHAVIDPAQWLEQHEHAECVLIPVDEQGRVVLEALEELISANPNSVALVSVMWANNEVGTVQPVGEVAAITAKYDIPLHTDAVQAIGQVPVNFAQSRAQTLALTGHKLGGPPGIGALLATRDAHLTPLIHGGGQERGVRSGTLDVPGAKALALAVRLAVHNQEREAQRLADLRDRLVAGILEVSNAILRGPDLDAREGDSPARLPGNAHVTFPGCEGDSLLYLLDSHGVHVSTGSACQAGVPQPSHVLLAMGIDETIARGALRFTLGHSSTDADVDAALRVLPQVVERAQAAGLAGGIA